MQHCSAISGGSPGMPSVKVAPGASAASSSCGCLQVRFRRYRFSATGELGYRGIRGAEG
jgi:hypothetical protein